MPFKFNPLTGNLDYYESGSGGGSASSITNTPAGNIAATDVQAAINELDTEKLPIAGGTITGDLTVQGNTSLGDAEATDTVTVKGASTVLANSANPALKVTQTGSGYSFVVEDAASDSTPFIIDASGKVGVQVIPVNTFDVNGNMSLVGGRLGIGTSSLPTGVNLYVESASATAVRFKLQQAGTGNFTIDMPASTNALVFYANEVEQWRMASTGDATFQQNMTVLGTTGVTVSNGNGSFNGGRFVMGLVGGNAGMSIGLDASPIQVFRVGANTLGIKNVSGGVQIQDGGLTVSGDTQTAGIESTNMAPSGNITIPAGYSSVISQKLTIASGKTLTLGLGAILTIIG